MAPIAGLALVSSPEAVGLLPDGGLPLPHYEPPPPAPGGADKGDGDGEEHYAAPFAAAPGSSAEKSLFTQSPEAHDGHRGRSWRLSATPASLLSRLLAHRSSRSSSGYESCSSRSLRSTRSTELSEEYGGTPGSSPAVPGGAGEGVEAADWGEARIFATRSAAATAMGAAAAFVAIADSSARTSADHCKGEIQIDSESASGCCGRSSEESSPGATEMGLGAFAGSGMPEEAHLLWVSADGPRTAQSLDGSWREEGDWTLEQVWVASLMRSLLPTTPAWHHLL